MELKIDFVERFVFMYDASSDGLGISYDVYEMFHIDNKYSLDKIYEKQTVKITKEQYNKMLELLKDYDGLEIIVFYELNKIPILAFFGEDYVELTSEIYDANDRFLKRSNYKQLEVSPEHYNWVKNNLKMKHMRYHICFPEEAES